MTSREAFYLWSMVLLLLGYVIPNDKVTNFIIWTDLEDWTVLAGLIERVRSLSKMSNVSDTINIYNYSSAGLPTENVYRVDRHLFSDTCQQQEGRIFMTIQEYELSKQLHIIIRHYSYGQEKSWHILFSIKTCIKMFCILQFDSASPPQLLHISARIIICLYDKLYGYYIKMAYPELARKHGKWREIYW